MRPCLSDKTEVFDKVTVLYEGRQIYFGPCQDAKQYFMKMGFDCASRQTTGDFLTSLTSSAERLIRPGWESRTPTTADEFATAWKRSVEYAKLMKEIENYNLANPVGGKSVAEFIASRRLQQAIHQYVSPLTYSNTSVTYLIFADASNLRIQCLCINKLCYVSTVDSSDSKVMLALQYPELLPIPYSRLLLVCGRHYTVT